MTDATPTADGSTADADAPAPRRRGPKPRRERQEEKRKVIMEAARAVFRRLGYDGASMNDIAQEAGVSKATLYVYFTSKEGLFAALIDDVRACLPDGEIPIDPEADVETALTAFGRKILKKITSDENVELLRLVMGASDKFPELGRMFYDAGPGLGLRMVTGYLENQVARGTLRIDDIETAAHQLLELMQTRFTRMRLFNIAPAPDAAAIEASVAAGVRVFLAAYGVPRR
ncbi:TetR/AcrR family transcriptional regulator [Segnochrobactraceae bacterium EtOH-i3]